MKKKGTAYLLILLAVLLLFGGFNLGMYLVMTRRLADNFGSASQAARMIDVEHYLPFDENSRVARLDREASLRLTDHLPVLDGATALLPVYSAFINAVYPADSVSFDGTKFGEDSAMQYKNTLRGYTAIVDGVTDLLFCAAPSEEQKAYAEEKGVKLVYVPVGCEAFVFFVNSQNPVEELTVEQVRDIYAGRITNWSQVGGISRAINPVTRMKGSGSQTAMDKLMAGTPYGRKSVFALTGASIGFSFRYYLDGIVADEGVKMLALNGVKPTPEAIRDRSYPIVSEFYAIYRADNDNPNLPSLLSWILSDEGQELVEKSGYVAVGKK